MRIVTDTAGLKALIGELEGAPYLALDTEFLRDQTYWPKLCLIQVASPTAAAIIDPLAGGIDLKPFYELLKKPNIVKVFHAARQDIEIFQQQGGVIPNPLFDTQVAAMVCGYGDAASYETLARRIAGVEIDKSSRFTDWSRRPLSSKQLEYAIGDVTHLRKIYEVLDAELKKTHREAWIADEISALQSPELYAMNPANAWKRLKARTSSKRFIALLAAIAEWREREAQTRDIPRGRVLKDEAILEIAAHPPESADAIERIRAIPKGFANSRLGKTLMEAIEVGRHAQPPEGIEPEKPRRKREPSQATIDLLKTLLRLRAEDANVAPRLIANADDIESLAAAEDEGVAALHGWRAEVFGNDAQALRKGELGIALSKGKAVVVKLDGVDKA
ncbi:MAG: ribonuclease D [Proteobacteria bacterium]|nr:ribonuclease D [Pseudomonadota bacterium]